MTDSLSSPSSSPSAPNDLDPYLTQLVSFRDHLSNLTERAPEGSTDTLDETLESLHVAMEELQVAGEEMRQQSEALDTTRLQVEEERERYRRLFDLAPDACLVTDAQGVIRQTNRAAEQMLGGLGERLIGKPLVIFVPEILRQELRSVINLVRSERRTTQWEGAMRERTGTLTPVDGRVAIFEEYGDGAISLLWILRDITFRLVKEEQIRRLNRELEDRVRERTVQLEEANQELVQQVAARGRAEQETILLNFQLQRAMTEAHHRIKNNLQLMGALADMLLLDHTETVPVSEVARLGSHARALAAIHDVLTHEATPHATGIPFRSGLEKLLDITRSLERNREIRISGDNPTLPAKQATALTLVANELLLNAFKHGQGAVEIGVWQREGTLVLQICDAGPGFPPDFDLNKNANTGLNLVANMTRVDLRAQVTYDNRDTGGACVRVVMPLPEKA